MRIQDRVAQQAFLRSRVLVPVNQWVSQSRVLAQVIRGLGRYLGEVGIVDLVKATSFDDRDRVMLS